MTTTVHIGGYFEWVNGSTARKYYYHNGLRVAMREGGELYFLLGDYLGSTSVSYRSDGQQTVTQRYYAWGDIRPGPDNELPTDYTFTGQRLDDGSRLVQMGARWYDSRTGRWLSADTVVPEPGNPQNLNRYTYVNNNPLHYTDPTGHYILESPSDPWLWPVDPRVRARYWYHLPGELTQPSDAEIIMAMTSPVWAPVVAVGAEATVTDLAVPAVEAGAHWITTAAAPAVAQAARQVGQRLGETASQGVQTVGTTTPPGSGASPGQKRLYEPLLGVHRVLHAKGPGGVQGGWDTWL